VQNKDRFDLIGARNIWFALSLVVIAIGIASIIFRGMNYGVDFTGGRIVQFRADRNISPDEIEKILKPYNIKHNPVQLIGQTGKEFVLRTIDYSDEKSVTILNNKMKSFLVDLNVELYPINKDKVMLKGLYSKLDREQLNAALKKAGFKESDVLMAGTKELPPQKEGDPAKYDVTLKLVGINKEADVKKLTTVLYKKFGVPNQFINENKVDPVFGNELQKKALLALIIATIGILLYVTIRFEFWYAIAAIIGLIHDAVITLGASSLLQIEVNGAFVAIILTVFGYSINDTIVIFDRIRENLRKDKKTPLGRLMNISLWETMARSINTVLTVELTILAILLFGGESLNGFMKGLLIGIGCGCYSSIFIAAPFAFIFKSAEAGRHKGQAGGRGMAGRAISGPAVPATAGKKEDKIAKSAGRPADSGKTTRAEAPTTADDGDKKKKKGSGGKQRRR